MAGLVETYGMRHAAKALADYDAAEPEREKLFEKTLRANTTAGSARAFVKWNKAVADAQLTVNKAFYEDTRDRNKVDCVKHVTLSFVREMVAKHPPK